MARFSTRDMLRGFTFRALHDMGQDMGTGIDGTGMFLDLSNIFHIFGGDNIEQDRAEFLTQSLLLDHSYNEVRASIVHQV